MQKRNLRLNVRTVGPFDIVFCGNVACYSDQDPRARLFRDIARAARRH